MPPAAKKYTVEVQLPVIGGWYTLARNITKAQAEVYAKTAVLPTRIRENDDA